VLSCCYVMLYWSFFCYLPDLMTQYSVKFNSSVLQGLLFTRITCLVFIHMCAYRLYGRHNMHSSCAVRLPVHNYFLVYASTFLEICDFGYRLHRSVFMRVV